MDRDSKPHGRLATPIPNAGSGWNDHDWRRFQSAASFSLSLSAGPKRSGVSSGTAGRESCSYSLPIETVVHRRKWGTSDAEGNLSDRRWRVRGDYGAWWRWSGWGRPGRCHVDRHAARACARRGYHQSPFQQGGLCDLDIPGSEATDSESHQLRARCRFQSDPAWPAARCHLACGDAGRRLPPLLGVRRNSRRADVRGQR